MESFINDIYTKSMLGQYLKQSILASRTGDFTLKRKSWACYASLMELIKHEFPDNATINELMQKSNEAKEFFLNDTVFADIIEVELLPIFYNYINSYTGVDVDDGQWRITSTTSGFLTISSLDNSELLHSQFDPMWEARQRASLIYNPKQSDYYILGGGLGYLAYQIWLISERTAKIHLYITNNNIYLYSKMYGVIDWIESSSLDVIVNDDYEKTIDAFLIQEKNGIIISETNDIYKSPLGSQVMFKKKNNQLLFGESAKISAINLAHNINKGTGIDNLLKNQYAKEWIVVASGPSLKDNIDYLRDNHGKKTIIAVSSALKTLIANNITPDICTVADPYDTLMPHIEGINDITANFPLVADCISNWKFIESFLGPKYFVTTKTEFEKSDFINIPTLYYGGTVSSLALAIAYYLHAKKIYLIGLDLGYPGGKHYASDYGHNNDEVLQGTHTVPSVDGKEVGTTTTFDAFRSVIESQIASNPNIPVINLSKHGALIKGAI